MFLPCLCCVSLSTQACLDEWIVGSMDQWMDESIDQCVYIDVLGLFRSYNADSPVR